MDPPSQPRHTPGEAARSAAASPSRGEGVLTPLMQQYHDLKQRHPTEILLFRLGDFYELFDEDAKLASPILEVALTHRQQVPMCGVPAHSVDPYIAKLLKAGLRVAIADQLEDPALVKGLVKRDVVRIMTAGTLREESLLPSKRSNYLATLAVSEEGIGLAAIESSTGEFLATEVTGTASATRLMDELARLAPSEIVLPKNTADALKDRLKKQGFVVAESPESDFSESLAQERLKILFGAGSLRGFGLENRPLALRAAGAAVRYLETTQCGRPVTLRPLRAYSLDDTLQIDAHTLDHLDLVRENHGSHPSKTLLDILDQTLTSAGGRMIRRWLVAPLRQLAAIQDRQQKVEFFLEGKETRRHLRALLQGWPDIERMITRLSAGSLSPRDLAGIGQALRRLPRLKAQLAAAYQQTTPLGQILPDALMKFLVEFPEDAPLAELLERAIVEGPPASFKEGGVIRDGYSSELDEIRGWIGDGKSKLLELEKRERDQTGIPSLKVAFNNIFGYYLEVTRAQASRVPPHYVRKQTMANAERYITPELKEFETRVLGAEERGLRLETSLAQDLRSEILKEGEKLQKIALQTAELDVVLSLAEVADRRRYCKPVVDLSDSLMIKEGRHPVLEEVLPAGTLVPNDVDLNGNDKQIMVLTGPNMSGKSTYLRQTALIAVMAQMGSYVPAAEARIGLLDQLFTRIGASDRLTEGESTFMVEMVETARILNHATGRSLVILDEVGRGTSTYDGISIAWACLEYLHGEGRPKVLFATHYFELTELADQRPGIRNAHVTAREWNDEVIFLHKVEPGPADRAYGIHVAKLAGVPKSVLQRAAVLLSEFEAKRRQAPAPEAQGQGLLFQDPWENDRLTSVWNKEFEQLDVNQMTPVQALLKLQEWKTRFRNTKEN